MPAGLRRHLVGKTLRDVSYSAPKIAPSIAMRPDNNEKLRKQFAPGYKLSLIGRYFKIGTKSDDDVKFVSHLPEMAKLSVKANVGLLLDYDNWAEWCAQTRQRNCTRAGDLQLCQGHDAESGLCQFADVGE